MNSSPISRRDLLKGLVGATALAGCSSPQLRTDVGARAGQPSEIIQRENQRAGTRDWMLTNTRIDTKTKYRCPWIEGYCSRTSVSAGDTISFHVSTNPPSPFTIEIYRMGYYGGSGGRHLLTLGPFKGITQPDPETGPKRLRECKWEPCVNLMIPGDWLSGIYLGKLT